MSQIQPWIKHWKRPRSDRKCEACKDPNPLALLAIYPIRLAPHPPHLWRLSFKQLLHAGQLLGSSKVSVPRALACTSSSGEASKSGRLVSRQASALPLFCHTSPPLSQCPLLHPCCLAHLLLPGAPVHWQYTCPAIPHPPDSLPSTVQESAPASLTQHQKPLPPPVPPSTSAPT